MQRFQICILKFLAIRTDNGICSNLFGIGGFERVQGAWQKAGLFLSFECSRVCSLDLGIMYQSRLDLLNCIASEPFSGFIAFSLVGIGRQIRAKAFESSFAASRSVVLLLGNHNFAEAKISSGFALAGRRLGLGLDAIVGLFVSQILFGPSNKGRSEELPSSDLGIDENVSIKGQEGVAFRSCRTVGDPRVGRCNERRWLCQCRVDLDRPSSVLPGHAP